MSSSLRKRGSKSALRLFAEYNVISQACCYLISVDEVFILETFSIVRKLCIRKAHTN